jgi:hypothetical protein
VENNSLIILGFISLFHVIGGAVLGSTLRSIVTDWPKFGCQHIFLLVWASLFGFMPLLFGFDREEPWFLLIQIAILGTTIAVTALAWNWLREITADNNMVLVLFGGVFLASGAVAGALSMRADKWFVALLIGGIFVLTGGALMARGLRGLWTGEDAE